MHPWSCKVRPGCGMFISIGIWYFRYSKRQQDRKPQSFMSNYILLEYLFLGSPCIHNVTEWQRLRLRWSQILSLPSLCPACFMMNYILPLFWVIHVILRYFFGNSWCDNANGDLRCRAGQTPSLLRPADDSWRFPEMTPRKCFWQFWHTKLSNWQHKIWYLIQ